jgi:hypothetical protein
VVEKARAASSGAELLELCSQRRKSALEDIDNMIADLGRREGGSVYKSTPTIDWILCADDHLIGIAICSDEALGFLNLLQQVIDVHGSDLHFVQVIGENPVKEANRHLWGAGRGDTLYRPSGNVSIAVISATHH